MYYNKENVERLRQRYPEGTRICLDQMNDDPFPVESGTLGKVDHVDDIGTLHCIFDNGRTLGVIPGVGRFSRYQRRIGTNRGRRNEYVNVTVKFEKSLAVFLLQKGTW